jgi:hypothetical protein
MALVSFAGFERTTSALVAAVKSGMAGRLTGLSTSVQATRHAGVGGQDRFSFGGSDT